MAKTKKLKSGNWRVLVYEYTDENKKRHYKSITAPTKKEAEYRAAEYSLNRNNSASYEDLTLAEAYQCYIDSKSAVLSPSTIAGYVYSKQTYFQRLMPTKLSKINAKLIQTAVNELASDYSPKTVRNAHGLLHSVIKAYRPNFQFNTTLPQRIKPDYIIPTTAEIKQLLNLADDKIRVPILLASNGGLRRSEICALTPDDISDFGVTVNKAAVIDKDKNIVLKTTKTVAGTRFVPLPQYIINEVRQWRYFGCSPRTLSTWYTRLQEKTIVPKFSFHKFRHYFASELHAQGIPDQYIAKIGGWETVDMLHKIYQHTLRDKQQPMEEKIINIFNTNFNYATQKIKSTD